jgi:hypothetical protein
MAEHMLTTTDNPFNPVTQFTEWDAWDRAAGHCTLALLGRVVITSDELSDADQAQAVEDAVQEIVRENASGVHRLVLESTGLPE